MSIDTTSSESVVAAKELSPCEQAYNSALRKPKCNRDNPVGIFEMGWAASQQHFCRELNEMLTDADWRTQVGRIPAVSPHDRFEHLLTGWIYRMRGMMDQIHDLNGRLSSLTPAPPEGGSERK